MERIVNNYDFLLDLVQSKSPEQRKLLDEATPQQVLAVIDCVKLCDKLELSPPGLNVFKRQKRWKRAVSVLKRNSKLLTPALVTILCTILREALFYMYSME